MNGKNNLESFFGPFFKDIFEIPQEGVEYVLDILKRKQEYDQTLRDEWGNWDGQFLNIPTEITTPSIDINYRNRKRWDWNGRGSFCLLITHDVDTLNPLGINERFRRIIRKNSTHKIKLLLGFLYKRFLLQRNEGWDFSTWIECELKYGCKSTWFIFPDRLRKQADEDCSYRWHDKVNWDPDSYIPLYEAIKKLKKIGFEIGLHGSYYSSIDEILLLDQISHLSELIGEKVFSHRNHYLRFDPIKTPLVHENADICIDSTLGMNRFVGFRTGTCFPHFQWCPQKNRITSVLEFPITIQDGALFSKAALNLTFAKARELCLKIMDTVESIGGCYNILFHPDAMTDSAKWELYEELLSESQCRGAWSPTLSEAKKVWLEG